MFISGHPDILAPTSFLPPDPFQAKLREALGEHYVEAGGCTQAEAVLCAIRNLQHEAGCANALAKRLYQELDRVRQERDEARAERDEAKEQLTTLNAEALALHQAYAKTKRR